MATTYRSLKEWATAQYALLDEAHAKDPATNVTSALVDIFVDDDGRRCVVRASRREGSAERYGLHFTLPYDNKPLRPIMTELAGLFGETTPWIIGKATDRANTIDAVLQKSGVFFVLKTDWRQAEERDERLRQQPLDGALYECYGGTKTLAAYLGIHNAPLHRMLLLSPTGVAEYLEGLVRADWHEESKIQLIDACRVIDHYLPHAERSDEDQTWDEDLVPIPEHELASSSSRTQ